MLQHVPDRVRIRLLESGYAYAPLPIIVSDGKGLLVSANKAFQNLVGHTEESLAGRRFFEFLHPDSVLAAVHANEQVARLEVRHIAHEIQMVTAGGKVDWVEDNLFAVPLYKNDDGTAEFLVRQLVPITARKHLEEQTEILLHELQAVAQMKEELVELAAHEFRTPLTAILGYSRMLYDWPDKFDTERTREMLQRVIENGERLQRLSENMLQSSTLTKLDVTARTDLSAVLTGIVDEVRMLPEGKRVEFATYGEGQPVACVDIESVRLIATNLLSNAAKFATEKSTVITTYYTQNEYAVIQVSDIGTVIPPSDLRSIFLPFRRSQNSNDKQIKGVGLGLYIVDKVVRAYQGEVDVEVDPELKIVSFKVRLPLARTGDAPTV